MSEKVVYTIDVNGNASSEIDKIKKGYEDFKKNVEAPAKEIPLAKQLRDMKLEMQKLDQAGLGVGNKQFDDLAKQAGSIRDSISAANDAIKTSAVGTEFEKQMNFVRGGIEAVNGSAQVIIGTMNAFGLSSKSAEEAVRQMMGLMTIANGVQQVYNALKKEGALVMGLYAIKNKAAATTQLFLNSTIWKTIVATRALKIALISTGVGAAAVALGFLVTKFIEVSNSTKDATDELIKFDKINQGISDNIKRQELVKSKLLDERKNAEINYYRSVGNEAKANALTIEGLLEAQTKLNDNWVLQQVQSFERDQKRPLTFDERVSITAKFKEQARIMKETLGYQIKSITEGSSALQNKDKNKLINAAPKTFNVYINELGRVDKPVIMNKADEKEFQQSLVQALTSAFTTIAVQTTR